MVRAALSVLRGLILLKRHAGPVLRVLVSPFLAVGRFLLFAVGVPLYRAFFFLRRLFGRIAGAAKHRAFFVVASRHLIHAVALAVALSVVAANVQARGQLRAEHYGRDSILYHLVADGTMVEVLETESAETAFRFVPSQYAADASLRADAHLDFISFDSEYATTMVGGSIAVLPGGMPSSSSGSAPTASPTTPRPPVPTRTETETYVIQSGDTLSGIAAKFGLNLNTILWANNLSSRSVLRLGASLTIPPVDGVYYTVKSGDTVARIAQTHRAEQSDILSANQLSGAGTLRIGQQLVIPGGTPPATPAPARTTPAPIQQLFQPPAAVTVTPRPADQQPVASRGSAAGQGTWIWPTEWRIITQYYGWSHTGVDIDGDYSTHSFAAADGTVIYSGWRNGYGMTVEIDHGGGYVTRYAHHSKHYVDAGDVVKAGDIIAQTGTTGRSTGTHLHFEVIKDGRFQNPLEYVR